MVTVHGFPVAPMAARTPLTFEYVGSRGLNPSPGPGAGPSSMCVMVYWRWPIGLLLLILGPVIALVPYIVIFLPFWGREVFEELPAVWFGSIFYGLMPPFPAFFAALVTFLLRFWLRAWGVRRMVALGGLFSGLVVGDDVRRVGHVGRPALREDWVCRLNQPKTGRCDVSYDRFLPRRDR